MDMQTEQTEMKFFYHWDKNEKDVLKKAAEFLQKIDLALDDEGVLPQDELGSTRKEITEFNASLYDATNKVAIQQAVDKLSKGKSRNNALIELLHPFSVGLDGKDSPYARTDLLERTLRIIDKNTSKKDDEQNNKNLIEAEGYIYHFEEYESIGQIKIIFMLTNERMKKFDQMFLASNFEFNGEQYALRGNKKEENIIDKIYYPYEYYYETTVNRKTALDNKWLVDNEGQLSVADDNYYKLRIRDLGLSPEHSSSVESHRKSSYEAFNKAYERIKDNYSESYKASENALYETLEEINTRRIAKNLTACHLGKLVFDDCLTGHGAISESVEKQKGNVTNQPKESPVPYKDILDKLFKSYKEADVTMYKVGLGNCIELLINYSDPSKSANMLIFDAGVNSKGKNYGYDVESIETQISDELKNDIEKYNVDTVYFMLSHYHPDHYSIVLNKLLEDSPLIQRKGIKKSPVLFGILPPCTNEHCRSKESDLIVKFKKNYCILEPDQNHMLFNENNIKVCQGTGLNLKHDIKDYVDASSIMIQLNNTILPGDAFFRYWPDGYGKIKDNASQQEHYKVFDYLIAPHHGWIDTRNDKDKTVVKGIYNNATEVIITRHDEGNDQKKGMPSVSDVCCNVGIDFEKCIILKKPTETDYSYSFTD